jgi:hypothetical protein
LGIRIQPVTTGHNRFFSTLVKPIADDEAEHDAEHADDADDEDDEDATIENAEDGHDASTPWLPALVVE